MRGIVGVSSSVRKTIIDTFTRADPQQVTKSVDGGRWKNLRGTWSINNNKLESSDNISNSNLPMVVQDIPFKDVNILQKSAQPGTSTALWVTDADNWWAVGIDSTTSACNCTNYECCAAYGCTGYGCTSSGCTSTGCTATGCTATGCTKTGCTKTGCTSYGCQISGCTAYGCRAYGCTGRNSKGNCISFGCTSYGCQSYGCASSGCTANGCTGYGCTATGCTATGCTATGCTGYGCTGSGCTSSGCTQNSTCTTCQTCYPRYIRVFQSVSNVISTIVSWNIGETAIRSFRVKTKGNIIKAQAYSDDDGSTVYGQEQTHDASSSSPQRTNRFGIVITPSATEQSKASGGIRIDLN
jgi:hypothetical protein